VILEWLRTVLALLGLRRSIEVQNSAVPWLEVGFITLKAGFAMCEEGPV
jgi:hypothetical protein